MKKKLVILILLLSIVTSNYGQDSFIDELNYKLSEYTSTHVNEDVFTITSSQFYEPGQIIEFKSYIRNWQGNANIKSKYLNVYLTNDQGQVITRRKYSIQKESVCNTLNIPKNINSGIYYLYALTEKNNSQNTYFKTIYISKDKFPEINTVVRYNKDYYFPGDTIQIKLKLLNIFGKHLKNKKIKYSIISQRETLENGIIKTNKLGEVELSFKIPEDFSNSMLKLKFEYKYASEKKHFSSNIKIVNKTLNISFYPEGGTLINNQNSNLAIKITDSSGFPVKTKGILKNDIDSYKFESNTDGIGLINFIPDINSSYSIELSQLNKLKLEYNFPKINIQGTSLKIVNLNPNYFKVIFNCSNIKDTLHTFWVLDQNGIIQWAAQVKTNDLTVYDVPCKNLNQGFARFTIFSKDQKILNERIIFIQKSIEQLDISSEISTSKDSLQIRLKISDQNDFHPYNSSVSIINKAYLDSSIANEFIQYYTIDPLIFNKEYSPGLYFKKGKVDYKKIEKISLTFKNNYVQWDTIFQQSKNNVFTNNNVKSKGFYIRRVKAPEELYLNEIKEYNNFRNYNLYLSSSELYFNNIYNNQDLYIKAIREIKKSNNQSSNHKKAIIKQLQNSSISLSDAIMQLKPYQIDQYGHILFRGHNSLLFEKGALIIVDGVKLGNNISHLNYIKPFDVEDIDILTSPSETLIYCALNCPSIILIKTKLGYSIYDNTENKPEQNTFQQNFLWFPNNTLFPSQHLDFKIKASKDKNNKIFILLGLTENNTPFYHIKEFE